MSFFYFLFLMGRLEMLIIFFLVTPWKRELFLLYHFCKWDSISEQDHIWRRKQDDHMEAVQLILPRPYKSVKKTRPHQLYNIQSYNFDILSHMWVIFTFFSFIFDPTPFPKSNLASWFKSKSQGPKSPPQNPYPSPQVQIQSFKPKFILQVKIPA